MSRFSGIITDFFVVVVTISEPHMMRKNLIRWNNQHGNRKRHNRTKRSFLVQIRHIHNIDDHHNHIDVICMLFTGCIQYIPIFLVTNQLKYPASFGHFTCVLHIRGYGLNVILFIGIQTISVFLHPLSDVVYVCI